MIGRLTCARHILRLDLGPRLTLDLLLRTPLTTRITIRLALPLLLCVHRVFPLGHDLFGERGDGRGCVLLELVDGCTGFRCLSRSVRTPEVLYF